MTGAEPLLYELTELPALGRMFPVTTFSALSFVIIQEPVSHTQINVTINAFIDLSI